MFAVVLKEDGYSGRATGPRIENAADWLEAAELPKAGAGQVVVKLRAASLGTGVCQHAKRRALGGLWQPWGQPAGAHANWPAYFYGQAN